MGAPQFTYDFARGRWTGKPAGTNWSEFVAGRIACSAALLGRRRMTVSCYETCYGKRHFTDPVREDLPAGPRVLYRIHVTLKPGVGAAHGA